MERQAIPLVAQIDRQMLYKRPSKIFGRLAAYGLFEGRPLTTKGQWINPLVFSGYRAAQALPQVKKNVAPIFIVGTGRSGTTILGKIFAMHKQTVFLNEPKALWHFAHGAEDMIGSYSEGKASVRLEIPENSEEIATKIARVYGWALALSGAQRVVDKYPELIFRVPFVRALFPDARFVCIIRDGVDTTASVNSWSKREGYQKNNEVHDWWGKNDRKWHMLVDQIVPEHNDLIPHIEKLKQTNRQLDRAAVEWILSMREAKKQSEKYPDDVLIVRYESLCTSTKETLKKIYTHCNLKCDQVVESYAQSVMTPPSSSGTISLMPEIIEPFIKVLADTGYGSSGAKIKEHFEE